MFLMYSPLLSLIRTGQHGLGFPSLFFSNCSYKIKRLLGFTIKGLKILNLGFVPTLFFFFFATINARSIGTYQPIGVNMKTVVIETIVGIVLFCGALALMLAYFDVLVK